MFSTQNGAACTRIRLGWDSLTVFLQTSALSYCAEGCFHSQCVNTSGSVRKVPASSLGRHAFCPARAYSWYPAVCCVSALKWHHDSIFSHPLHFVEPCSALWCELLTESLNKIRIKIRYTYPEGLRYGCLCPMTSPWLTRLIVIPSP
jgi:hypothetical protein